MTPTMLGRWQTRLFLMTTLGTVLTLPFALLSRPMTSPFIILTLATIVGLGWDILYTSLQKLRWDRDWPPIFFLGGGLLEAALLWAIIGMVDIPGLAPGLTRVQFAMHYTTVWLISFMVMLGPLRILLIHWRFQGGEWVK